MNQSRGIGLFGLLGVTFVVLKLVGVIDWSWWWVTLPFWGGIALVLAVLAIYIAGGVIYNIWLVKHNRKVREKEAELKAAAEE